MVDAQTFKDVLSTLPNAVFVIGIENGGKVSGCTVSSIVSLDVDKNQKLLFTLGKNSKFGSLIVAGKKISVNLLGSTQISEALHFAKVRGEIEVEKKFKWNSHSEFSSLEGCEAYFTCQLNRKIDSEANTIYLLNVIELVTFNKNKPLVYSNRRFDSTI